MVDPAQFIQQFSLIGALALIGLIVYAESGFLVGLFLPGDTLLLVAGVFAAQGALPLGWTMFVIFIGATLGDNTGYFIGRATGPRIFKRHKGLLFRQEYLRGTEAFYQKHGGKTVIIARFIGYVRTLVPIIAGVGKMRRRKFIVYNIIGAGLWTFTFVMLGYLLGVEAAKQIERYFVPSIFIGALLILSPSLVYLIRKALRSRR
jgi:membrane-associated protein